MAKLVWEKARPERLPIIETREQRHAGYDADRILNQSETRKHFYRDVPKLGHVAVSRHAQSQMIASGITQSAFDKALLAPTKPDIPDGADILWRERDGLRIVILVNPTPNTGAKLVKTVFRVKAQAKAK